MDETQLGEGSPSIHKLVGLIPAAHKLIMVTHDVIPHPASLLGTCMPPEEGRAKSNVGSSQWFLVTSLGTGVTLAKHCEGELGAEDP